MTSLSDTASDLQADAIAAATNAAGLVPSSAPLTAGRPAEVAGVVASVPPGAVAVVADVVGATSGTVLIVAENALGDALAASPMGPLPLVEALRPDQVALLVDSLRDLELRDALVAWLCPGSLPADCLSPDVVDAVRTCLPRPDTDRRDQGAALAGRRHLVRLQHLVKDFGGKLLNGPNDLWIRPDGNLYFTDPLYPRNYWKRDKAMQQPGQYVYFFDMKLHKATAVATDLTQPNGIIGTPNGRTLYVADIGAKKTYAYDTTPQGPLQNKRLFCELGSDGMTIDEDGNVYLTGQGVTIFDKSGKKIENIPIPEPWTANVTFGGKDRHLLFITASKKVYGVKMRVKGAY